MAFDITFCPQSPLCRFYNKISIPFFLYKSNPRRIKMILYVPIKKFFLSLFSKTMLRTTWTLLWQVGPWDPSWFGGSPHGPRSPLTFLFSLIGKKKSGFQFWYWMLLQPLCFQLEFSWKSPALTTHCVVHRGSLLCFISTNEDNLVGKNYLKETRGSPQTENPFSFWSFEMCENRSEGKKRLKGGKGLKSIVFSKILGFRRF